MTHTDPRLTITLTTHAAEGLRGEAIQRFVPDSTWLLRMAEKENGCCISAGGWVARVKAAEREEANLVTAVDELLDYFAGMNTQSNYLLGLLDQLKAARKPTENAREATAIPTVSSSDLCPECGSSKWTPNGDCPACVERDAESPGIIASLDALRVAGGDAWDKVEDAEGELERNETARQTAIDMDAHVRHGRIVRLVLAARAVAKDCEGGMSEGFSVTLVDRLRDALAVFTDIDAIPTQTEAEAETEGLRAENEELRKEVNSLRSQITRECWIEGNELLKEENRRLKADVDRSIEINNELERENVRLAESLASFTARNADRRAKLDALVGAVDKVTTNANSLVIGNHYYGWTGVLVAALAKLRTAADAARQPTEAP